MKKILLIAGLSIMIIGCNKKSEQNTALSSDSTQVKDSLQNAHPDPVHNSQNSLDYAGTYTGTIPCADCEGIETELVLNSNSTYSLTLKYLGKEDNSFKSTGFFKWSKDGNSISLDKDATTYKVSEGKLIQLDAEGQEITGELASKYILTKK